jgi:hypothetical protein
VSGLGQAANIARRVSSGALLVLSRAAAGLAAVSPLLLPAGLVGIGFWWHEHDVRIRQAAQLEQTRKQAQADISRLKTQAAEAMREANVERAREVAAIEMRNLQLESNARTLQRRLEDLVGRARTQVEEVATLPTAEVMNRVATQLALSRQDLGMQDSGAGVRDSGIQASTTPARSGQKTPGMSNSPAGKAALSQSRSPAPELLNLSGSALRKVEAALVELDSCAQVRDSLLSNCHGQVAAKDQIIGAQKASIVKLNEALTTKDQILSRREQVHRAELESARGTWSRHAVRTLEMVGIGVALGVAIRH